MTVVDASALVAIMANEPERSFLLQILAEAQGLRMSALNLYETQLVVRSRLGEFGLRDLDMLLDEFAIEIVPFTKSDTPIAVAAYARFGKGIHPIARLNFGDCAAYALAKSLGAPLLYKGGDFAATDIEAAAT